MNNKSSVQLRIEIIRTIFQEAKHFASKLPDFDELFHYLESTDAEFRSVAYEGASMALAQNDFIQNHSIKKWNQFVKITTNQASHVHIGLGWAIAADSISALSFLNTIHPMMQSRVWDGCGFYSGIFKYRTSIKNQETQSFVTEKDFPAFDQGLGRSLWYSCKGDVNAVAENIKKFSSLRHPDLWRGVGIASVYVGGCDVNIYKSFFSLAGKHRKQLGIGVAMVAKSRSLTNCLNQYTELACNVWCNLSARDVLELAISHESSANTFASWLDQIAKEIITSDKKSHLSIQ